MAYMISFKLKPQQASFVDVYSNQSIFNKKIDPD